MGMETLLVVSPDKLEPPPVGSRSCLDTSLTSDSNGSTDLFATTTDSQATSWVEDNVDTADATGTTEDLVSFVLVYVHSLCFCLPQNFSCVILGIY